MRGLAYQAVKAAESLPPDEHAPPARLDLPARAWTALANAFRVNEDYAEADAALARARGFLRRGSGDLHLLATIAPMEASLRSSQRRFAEGRELLAKAYRLNVKLGNHHLAGSVLISQGSLAGFEGDFQQAVSSYRRGLALVDPDREPQLVAIGLHGLITSLVECGQSREAGRLLLKSDLRRWLPSSNVRWAEGKLLAGLGQLKKGEGALTTVHAELRETGRSNAAALVGLDLIPILLQRGKHGRARAIARESYEVFRALGLRSDAAEAKSYLL
jgi:tetratricopeptide (TPR) repeat protein